MEWDGGLGLGLVHSIYPHFTGDLVFSSIDIPRLDMSLLCRVSSFGAVSLFSARSVSARLGFV